MGVSLGPGFAVDFTGYPPHMSAIDVVLWRRLLQRGPLPYLRLFFDVAVGSGAAITGEVSDAVRKSWERITRQRIDVVAEGVNEWVIYELRGAAGPGAIGSLIAYKTLWLEAPLDDRPLRLVLVTDSFSDALRPALAQVGIELILV